MTVSLGIDIGGSSIKAVVIDDECVVVGEATSDSYSNPDRQQLADAIQQCVHQLALGQHPEHIGLSVPGKMNSDHTCIETSFNLPVLEKWLFKEILSSLCEFTRSLYCVVSDARAAGYGYVSQRPIQGTSVIISVGTGVGYCVFEGDRLVHGTGHLGQLDVGRCDQEDRFDKRGTRNTLETYIGAPSLITYMRDGMLNLTQLNKNDPPVLAIVQAFRVLHALYTPSRIVLLGGVGFAFESISQLLVDQVNRELTPLAECDWTLEFGSSRHLAAIGAAMLAQSE